jgi:queuine tRNA-ribosyltransferase
MSKAVFKELARDENGSRSGILHTRAGLINTPFFMPVATRGAVKGLEPAQVAATGAHVLLSNTYHLHLSPGEKVIKKLGGLPNFAGWQGPMLTDSGGFQVFSLSKVRKITEEGVEFKDPGSGDKIFISPEKSMQIQLDLGTDIIMAFDDLTGLDEHSKARTNDAVERTHRWLERCVEEFNRLTKDTKNPPLLFGIVQGGLDKNLRQKSLEFVQSQAVSGVAIGGLSVGEPRKEMHEMLDFLAPLYDPARVRYLMGVGDPIDVRHAIERGIDMMDCVMPTRNARHGTVWISGDKRLNLKNAEFLADKKPIDKTCDCHTCTTGYTRAYLRQLYKSENPLAGSLASIHNLRYIARIFEEYR